VDIILNKMARPKERKKKINPATGKAFPKSGKTRRLNPGASLVNKKARPPWNRKKAKPAVNDNTRPKLLPKLPRTYRGIRANLRSKVRKKYWPKVSRTLTAVKSHGEPTWSSTAHAISAAAVHPRRDLAKMLPDVADAIFAATELTGLYPDRKQRIRTAGKLLYMTLTSNPDELKTREGRNNRIRLLKDHLNHVAKGLNP